MTVRTVRFVVALTLLIVAGVFLNAGRANGDDSSDPAEPAGERAVESLSPSQEAQVKINEIRRNEFFYQSYGKGDPFQPLVTGEFEESQAAELVDLNSGQLVGVVWGTDDRFALVEDGEGFGYILRVGDRVRNGRVVSIRKTSLSARITLYGITSTVVLRLEKTEG